MPRSSGLQADDVVQIVGLAMQAGVHYPTLRDVLPIHPTVAEYLPSMLGARTTARPTTRLLPQT